MEKTLHVEEDIHAIAALLDGFFKELFQQPSRTWAKSITDTLLLPFLKRREILKAVIFGERNALARSLNLAEPRRQDWLVWLIPLLMQPEDVTESVGEEKAAESVTSIGVVMITACLHWAFLTQTSEEFGTILTEMQNKIEGLGWSEMTRSRVQAVYKGLVSKITHRWTTENTNHFWHSLNVLASQIEDFIFYTPLYGFRVKPDLSVLGLHIDKNGLCEKDLLHQLTDLLVLQIASGKQQTVNRMTDKRETAEFNKHKEALEETRLFLVCALTWALSFAAGLEGPPQGAEETRKKGWSAARDGSHVNVNDRVQAKKQEDVFSGVVTFKGLIGANVMVGVCLDEKQGNGNGVHAGKQYFVCADGFGIFVKPENVQLEEIFVSPVYDKATVSLVTELSKRPRFKFSSKKQALDCFRSALLNSLRSKNEEKNHVMSSDRLSVSPSNEWMDISFDSALDQARAASQSLHRMVGFIGKVVETKTAYVQSLDKATQQDEATRAIADEMSACVEISAFVKYLENSMSTRIRNFVTVVTSEVLQPFQALETDYEAFLGGFKSQYARIARELEQAKISLLKLLEECEKELSDVMQTMKHSDLSTGKALRRANAVQRCATFFGRYEQASAEYSTKSYPEARASQRKLIKDFEAREQHRLLSTQVYIHRYVTAFAVLNDVYPQIGVFEKELVQFSASVDITKFVTKAQRPEIPLQIPSLPCSAVDMVTGAFVDIMMKKEKPEPAFETTLSVERGVFTSDSHRRQVSRDLNIANLKLPSPPPPPGRSLTTRMSPSRNALPRPSVFSKLYQKVTDIFPDASQGVEVNDAAAASELTHFSFPLSSIRDKWLFHSDEYLSSQADPGPSAALHGALCCLRKLFELGGGAWASQLPIEVGLLSKTSDCGSTSVSMGLAWVYFQEKKDNQAVAFLVCGNGGTRLQLYVKTKGVVSCVLEYRPPSIKGALAHLRCGSYIPAHEVGVEQLKLDIQSLLSSAPWIANDKFRAKLAKQFKIAEKKLVIPIFGYVSGAIRDHWELAEREDQQMLEATINAILGSCLGPESQFSVILSNESSSYLMRQLLEGQMELVACRALYRQCGAVTGQHLEPVISLGVGKRASQWTSANATRIDDYTLYCLEPPMKFGMESEHFPERLCAAIMSKYKTPETLVALMQSVIDRGGIPTIALKSGCLLKLSQTYSGRQRRKALVEPTHLPRFPAPVSVVFTRRSGNVRCRHTLKSASVAVACADACRVLAGSEDGDSQFLRVELEGHTGYLQDLSSLTAGAVLTFWTANELKGKSLHHRHPSDNISDQKRDTSVSSFDQTESKVDAPCDQPFVRESVMIPPPPARDSDSLPGPPPRDSSILPGPPPRDSNVLPGPPPRDSNWGDFLVGRGSVPGPPLDPPDSSLRAALP